MKNIFEKIRKIIARFCMRHITCFPLFLFACRFIFTISEMKHIETAMIHYVAIHRNDNHQMKHYFYRIFVNKTPSYTERLEARLKNDLK